MQKELSAQQDNSAMARLAAKIIDNFQLRISHVHVRFEDHSYLSLRTVMIDPVRIIPLLPEWFWRSCVSTLRPRRTKTMEAS